MAQPGVESSSSSAKPAFDHLLKLVPDDAALVTIIPDFAELVAGVQAFGSASGIKDLAELDADTLFDDLEISGLAGEWQQRVRKDGPFLLVLNEPDADPLLICTVSETGGPPGGELIQLKGNVLIAAPHADAMDEIKKASGSFAQRFEKQARAALKGHNLAVLIDVPSWAVQIEQMISLVEVFSRMGVAATSTQAAQPNLMMLNWMFKGLRTAFDESETVVIAVRIDADGVHVGKLTHFRPAGKIAEYLRKVRKPDKDLLRGLGAERGMIIVGTEWVLPADLETLSEQMLQVMLAAGAGQPTTSPGRPADDAEWKRTVRQAMQLYRRINGYNSLMTFAADRPGIVASGLYLTDDPRGVLESIPDVWKVSEPMMRAMAPGFSMEVTDEPATIGSVKARVYRFTFAADDEQMQSLLKRIYGESTTLYVAPHPEGVVYTMGPADAARQNVEKLLAGKAPRLADDQRVAAALNQLSPKPQALVLVDLPQLLKLGMQFADVLESEMPPAELPETPAPYVAFSLYLHEASSAAELFLPAKALKVVIDWFEEATEAERGSQPY